MRIMTISVLILAACTGPPPAALSPAIERNEATETAPPPEESPSVSFLQKGAAQRTGIPPLLSCLQTGYGRFIETIIQVDDAWTVVLTTGERLRFDDGATKTFAEKLDNPDLEDQVSIPYPKGGEFVTPQKNDDPGRIRVEALFKAVYGDTATRVVSNLVDVAWLPRRLGKSLAFNRMNGAADALSKVSAVLDERLPKETVEVISRPSGAFNWRTIEGTDRLSAHAFGIAVDINAKRSRYWRWEKAMKPLSREDRLPGEVIDAFESNGFIWGGKWYHYDTMHFEYRPELLARPCLR